MHGIRNLHLRQKKVPGMHEAGSERASQEQAERARHGSSTSAPTACRGTGLGAGRAGGIPETFGGNQPEPEEPSRGAKLQAGMTGPRVSNLSSLSIDILFNN